MRVIFMGTPAFALPALQALIDSAEHEVVAAYCQPPRPAGRGKKLRASPVQQLAEAHNIPVHHPVSLKAAEEQQIFAGYQADVAVVAAYGLLLPQAILDAPKQGCINIHPSALPRWRGAAPIQRTIMAGDAHTECCIMQMDAGLDTGAVLARMPYPIAEGTNAGALHDAMANLGANMVLEVLANPFHAIPQSSEGASYAGKITAACRLIDWAQPATTIQQQILGLSPSPAALLEVDGERWKILDAATEPTDKSGEIGATLDNALLVATGSGALRLKRLQRPSKNAMDATDFLRGTPIGAGTALK